MVWLLSTLFFVLVHLVFRDAWANHKDLDPFEAKWLYVDALLKVCHTYCLSCEVLRDIRYYGSILERP